MTHADLLGDQRAAVLVSSTIAQRGCGVARYPGGHDPREIASSRPDGITAMPLRSRVLHSSLLLLVARFPFFVPVEHRTRNQETSN
jgi:hypothetical protein